MVHVLVLDADTSSVRASLVDEGGRLLVIESERLTITSVSPGATEQYAESWWEACTAVLAGIAASPWGAPAAIIVTNQQITTVPVDVDGKPLAPAMLWMDQRPAAVIGELSSDIAVRVRETTGVPLSSSWAPSRALWWKQHAPEVFAAADAFLTVDAFLYSRPCGRRVTDPSNACFGLLDLHTDTYSEELAALVGLDLDAFPEVLPSGSVVGTVSPGVSAATGLPAGLPVVLSGSDQPCAAVGMGVLVNTDVAVTTGTGTFVVRPSPTIPDDDRFIVNRHVAGERYLVMGLHYLSGAAWNWFVDTFDLGVVERAQLADRLLNEVWARESGQPAPILNPYFSGARTPAFDDAARATWTGMGLGTTRADLAYSVLESNGFGVRQILDALEAVFASPAAVVRLAGGPSRSREWCQLQADAIGVDCARADNPESTTLGAAVVAMVGVGIHPDVEAATARCIAAATPFAPDPAQARRLAQRRTIYTELAERLRGITHG